MLIDYCYKEKKFLVSCSFAENGLLMGIPNRKFRKRSSVWVIPPLSRSLEAMKALPQEAFSPQAQAEFKLRTSLPLVKDKGSLPFPDWIPLKHKPMEHQRKGLNKFFPIDAAAIFFEQGLGKTFTSINLVSAWRLTGQIDQVCVICLASIKLVWLEELEKHCPVASYTAEPLMAGKKAKIEKFIAKQGDFKWLIVAVEGLSQGSASTYVDRFISMGKTAIIVDESSNIKTPGKIRTDKVVAFGAKAKKRVILSGTSVTQGLEDLYKQYEFLDPNILGFDSYYSFRAHFCETITMQVAEDRKVQKVIGYKNQDEFIRLIEPYTLRVEKKDAVDLPEKVYSKRIIPMTPKQRKLYLSMEQEFFTCIDGQMYETESVLEQVLRLQQITGGFYPFDDGEKVVPRPIEGKNPKLEDLMSLLDEISGKVIVWCEFRSEIELIAERLLHAGIKHVEFHGGCDDDEKVQAVKSFRDPEMGVKVFLASRAAAYGLTLIEATTSIYFSQRYSLDTHLQSQDRNHRIGQTNKVNYIFLMCEKTIDEKVMNCLIEKKTTAEMVYSLMKHAQNT